MLSVHLIFIIFLSIFVLISSAPQESASFIEMGATVVDNIIAKNSTNVSIFLYNTGDEIAYDVELYLVPSENFYSEKKITQELLYPGGEALDTLSINVYKNISLGIYPLVIILKYKDANGYQFSSLVTSLIKYKKGYDSKVEGSIYASDIKEDGSGTYSLYVTNFDDKTHDVKINLYLPEKFNGSFSQKIVPIDLVSDHTINFNIKNKGILPNSNYLIYVALEYDYNGFHYSSIAKGTVVVDEKKEKQPIWAYLTIIFVVLLVIYVYYKKRENK